MKKVLLLAYDFPPFSSAGALRPFFWAKYLSESGMEVTVVTRKWEIIHKNHLDYISPSSMKTVEVNKDNNFTILQAPYKPSLSNRIRLSNPGRLKSIFGKVLSGLNEFFQFVLPIGPKRTILRAADDHISQYGADVIIATGDPFVLFKYASILSKKHNIPWISDYRDPWSQDLTVQKGKLLKRWYQWQEKKIVNTASGITTVSEFLATNLKQLLGNREIRIIPNGYDHEIINKYANNTPSNKVMTIALAGTIYPWNPIESFLEKLSEFVETKHTVKFDIYGTNIEDDINTLISKRFPNLDTVVEIHPKIPYDQLISKLAQSDLLLLFNYYSSMGTKIYDYIGLNRKMIFCYTDDEESYRLKEQYYLAEEYEGVDQKLQEKLIVKTESGILVRTKEELLTVLEELNSIHASKGMIPCDNKHAAELSRIGQINYLANLIEQIS